MTAGDRGDRGSTSVELVLVAPVFLAALFLMVGLGRIVEAESRVQGAARDAARAASIARTADAALDAAHRAAAANLAEQGVSCVSFEVAADTASFRPGGQVRVTVACTANLSGLGLSGLPGSRTLRADSSSPLEQYRGTG